MHTRLFVALALLPILVSPPAVGAPAASEAAVAALLDRAKLWESRGRPELAREMIAKLFRIAPENPDGLAALGQLDASTGRTDSARIVLDRLRLAQPSHPGIARVEGLLRISSGNDKDRLREARQLSQQSRLPGHRDQLPKALAAYRTLFPNGFPDGDLALEYWQLLAEQDGNWLQVHEGLARLVKNYPDNLRYRFALAEHETSRLPLNRQALTVIIDMASLPEFQRQARAAWRRAIMRLEPAAANLRLLQDYLQREPSDTVVLERVKFFAQAEENLRRLMADPAYRARVDGLALLERGDLEAADAHFDRALRELPADPEIIGGLGLVRLRQGHHAQAQGLFQQALRGQPELASKWQALIAAAQFWGLLREVGDARSAGEFRLAEDKLREAMQINPREVAAVIALARIRDDQGDAIEAERNYRKALDMDPANRDALAGLIGHFARTGKPDQARQVIAGLTADQRTALGKELGIIEAGMLRQQAEDLVAQGRGPEAVVLLEQAVLLDADDPWLRFGLARQYAVAGERQKGLALFEELLARRADDPAALYALALYRSGGDEPLEALHTLERIGSSQRDAKTTALQRELWARIQTQRVRDAMRDGNSEAARTLLLQTEKAVAGDAVLTASVALAWTDLGNTAHARQLMAEQIKASRTLSLDWYIDYGEILARSDAVDEMNEIFTRLPGKPSPEQAQRIVRISDAAMLRRVDSDLAAGNVQAAEERLARLLAQRGATPTILSTLARTQFAAKKLPEAEDTWRRLLYIAPGDGAAHVDLARLLIAARRNEDALAQIKVGLAAVAPEDIRARVSLLDLLVDLKSSDTAKENVADLLARAPDNVQAHVVAARLALVGHRPDEAIPLLQRGLALEQAESIGAGRTPGLSTLSRGAGDPEAVTVLKLPYKLEKPPPVTDSGDFRWRQLATTLDQRASWLSGGVDYRSRAGTYGVSQYDVKEIPIEWIRPLPDGGRMLLQAEPVEVQAGRLAMNDYYAVKTFGSLALCQPVCRPVKDQVARGTALAVGYQRADLRADVGTTPLGFAVTHLVGGIVDKGDFGPFSWSAELSRRPVTGSLLSYAGTRDPQSGRIWGGVVATGVRLGLSRDDGGAFGFWSSLGLHHLTGQNVADNRRWQLMAGGYWRAINQENRLLSLGLTGMDWRFDKNVGEYTFGHGGYYSPQRFQSIALPLTYGERFDRFSYVVRAAVSRSVASTAGAAYYPTNPQMMAGALANGVDPNYTASSGSGKSKGGSFHAAFEYQVGPKLFLGGRMELDRSPDYTPDRTMLYLRYNLDRTAAQPVRLPPESLQPYSQF
jgi:tetratricopeptide (TPR) repeat protein